MKKMALIVAFLILIAPTLVNMSTHSVKPKIAYQTKNLGKLSIVILADGLDYQVFENVSTPNMDELSNLGYLFESNSILPSSTTAATAAIATGAYPNASGVVHTYAYNADEYHQLLSDEQPTRIYFSQMLNATTIFEELFDVDVKTALISAKSKLEVMLGSSGAVDRYILFDWEDYMTTDPHEETVPLEPRIKLLEAMTNATIETIDYYKPFIELGEDVFIFLAYPEPDWSGHAAGPNSSLYKGIVSFIDGEIGRIYNKLIESSLWDRSLVIITPDHGYAQVDPSWNIMNPSDTSHLTGLNLEHVISPTAGNSLFIYLKDLNNLQEAVNQLLSYPWTGGIWTRTPVEGANGTLDDIGLNSPYAGDIFIDIKPPYYASPYTNKGAHGGVSAQKIPIIVTGGAIDTQVNVNYFDQLYIAPTIAEFFGSDKPSKSVYDSTPIRFKPQANIEFSVNPQIAGPGTEVNLVINYSLTDNIENGKIVIDVVNENGTLSFSLEENISGTEGTIEESFTVADLGITSIYVYVTDENGFIYGGSASRILVAEISKPPRAWDKIIMAIVISIILAILMLAIPIYLKKRGIPIQ